MNKIKIDDLNWEWEPGTDKRSQEIDDLKKGELKSGTLKERAGDDALKGREIEFMKAWSGDKGKKDEKKLTPDEIKRQAVLFEALGIPKDKIPGLDLKEMEAEEKKKFAANIEAVRKHLEEFEAKLDLKISERKTRELAETRKKLDTLGRDVNLKESTTGGLSYEAAMKAIELHERWQAGKIDFGQLLDGLEKLGVFQG